MRCKAVAWKGLCAVLRNETRMARSAVVDHLQTLEMPDEIVWPTRRSKRRLD